MNSQIQKEKSRIAREINSLLDAFNISKREFMDLSRFSFNVNIPSVVQVIANNAIYKMINGG